MLLADTMLADTGNSKDTAWQKPRGGTEVSQRHTLAAEKERGGREAPGLG